ncbi:MAG: tRNA 2-thiouridine(34) synthase MnmA [Phycisphaerae bacterium]|nr:tRNA 2-thiouridine(34) synthase MnmA [Phycisphaerae bacterium]
MKILEPTFGGFSGGENQSIAVLMSGGVDSSVSAYRLKQAGWNVVGITMIIPMACQSGKRACCGADAAFVCERLGLPHYFVNVADEFNQRIVEPFRQAYASGYTPNPCAECNAALKFGVLWDALEAQFGITHLATGHYARLVRNGSTRLACAKDADKDQSYFLYGIPRRRLERLELPVSELTKPQVRKIAREAGIPVSEKPESMELCFAGEGDYRLALGLTSEPGDLLDIDGNKIGTHTGIANYTIGQRRGLGFAGGQPLYVCRIDPTVNTVTLGTREQVSSRTVGVENTNVLIDQDWIAGRRLTGKVRSYAGRDACTIMEVGEGTATVEFERSIFAPCPGQKLVLYNQADEVVGGGSIRKDTIIRG